MADWKRVREVFEAALDHSPAARRAFVERACASDSELRRRVETLLDAHEESGAFLEGPVLTPTEPWPDAAGPVTSTDELETGAVLDGKYQIEGLLGRGGMGAVYRAKHVQLERPVALKVIRSDRLADRMTAERFRREAVAVARLRHPNIVTVYDYGLARDAGAYIVMELLEGRSLRAELAARKRIEVRRALDLAGQICAGVAAAHRAGIVHRDLKPDNIFLETPDGATAVKVLDFGLAKLEEAVLHPGEIHSIAGAVFGTPAYMSPEQCRGEAADVRSDVYALGCVLYEMVTGEPPFRAAYVESMLYRHQFEAPRPPAEVAGEIPIWLDEVLGRALSKAPEDRYQSVEELARALGRPAGELTAATVPAAAATHGGGAATGALPAAGPSDTLATHNLPQPVTLFVGRDRAIGEVRAWLGRSRLVTLVGPGGIGKSRLALEVAFRVAGEYGDGVRLVELAALSDPTLLGDAVASRLGVRDRTGRPAVEALVGWLQTKELLLLLDNCEHMVDACASLAQSLLEACPRLRVLATSREALGIGGEAIWAVPPLGLPAPDSARDSDEALGCEAVRLFVNRASLRKPNFEPGPDALPAVLNICRRLEGIPLAIELAAARVSTLSVEQILQRLDDRFGLLTAGARGAPARQQTLRATIDWSHELLNEPERGMLRRLSAFSGGWTLDAAERVSSGDVRVTGSESDAPSMSGPADCGPDRASRFETLELLSRLVDKSLVTVYETRGTVRYGMLEMIREYGLELLARSGEADSVRRAHAGYFLELAEEAYPSILRAEEGALLRRLELEQENMRAALAFLLREEPGDGARLAAALYPFWQIHSLYTEGRLWLARALSAGPAPAALRAQLHRGLSSVELALGDLGAAADHSREAVAASREAGDAQLLARALNALGSSHLFVGDTRRAREAYEEGLAIARSLGNERLTSSLLGNLGELARAEGDCRAAQACYEQALEVQGRHRRTAGSAITLSNLGALAIERRDPGRAHAFYREALEITMELGDAAASALALDGLAAAAVGANPERAARLAGAAEAICETVGVSLQPLDQRLHDGYVGALRASLDADVLEREWARGRAMTLEEAAHEAFDP